MKLNLDDAIKTLCFANEPEIFCGNHIRKEQNDSMHKEAICIINEERTSIAGQA